MTEQLKWKNLECTLVQGHRSKSQCKCSSIGIYQANLKCFPTSVSENCAAWACSFLLSFCSYIGALPPSYYVIILPSNQSNDSLISTLLNYVTKWSRRPSTPGKGGWVTYGNFNNTGHLSDSCPFPRPHLASIPGSLQKPSYWIAVHKPYAWRTIHSPPPHPHPSRSIFDK